MDFSDYPLYFNPLLPQQPSSSTSSNSFSNDKLSPFQFPPVFSPQSSDYFANDFPPQWTNATKSQFQYSDFQSAKERAFQPDLADAYQQHPQISYPSAPFSYPSIPPIPPPTQPPPAPPPLPQPPALPINSPSPPSTYTPPAAQTGLYSSTGFDMLSVLAKVATRPNPKIVLGPVDLTCSFVVVDVRKFDQPIVYASPTFFKLTGYDASEIIGRNCRFLQSPSGHVQPGERRKYTDGAAVAHIKKSLLAGEECQASLINYRKGGTPWINLVSVIPVKYPVEDGAPDQEEIRYQVGFQVDLEKQPGAILKTMRDGTYIVNYSSLPGRDSSDYNRNWFGGISDDLRKVLRGEKSAITAVSEDQERTDLNMMILDHSDDFVHVLSLKGAFLYVSPSVRRILEYTQEELVGKFIDNITHPSDIVSVTRELKESSSTSSSIPHNKIVSMLFRVRRKHSGYVWLESSGRLHLDQGKGRKVVIMSGRVRPMMPNFMWNAISQCGGLGETEFWCQISSHTGLLISVSSNVHEIMGSKASNMIGRRLIDFVGTRWRASVDQALEEAAMASDQTAPSPSNIPQHTLFNEPRKVECYVCGRNGTEVPVLICFYPLDGPAEPGGPPSPSATGGARVGQNGTAAGRGAIKTASVTCQIRVIPSFTSPSTNRWNSSTSTTSRQLPTSAQLHGAMFQQYGHDRYGTGTTSGSRVANPPSASISSFPPPQLSLQLPSHNLDHYLQARRVHPIVHTLSSPVFEELDTNRSTSWQYELEQIRISNRRMRDEIEALTTVSGTQPDDMRGRR